jgi:CheY-like chemotaxis protein
MMAEKKDPFILLVEDNCAIREALVWALEYSKYSVVTVRNGQEALSFLEHDVLPNVIFLDLMMPVLDGIEFRERKKTIKRIKDIPIIIASAKTNLEKIDKLPHESFMSKPFELNDLLGVIKKYFEPQ